MLYVYQGSITLDGEQVERGELVVFDGPLNTSIIHGEQGSGVMLLLGDAIGEPISQYGPFVMNTTQEIEQAIRDYQQGRLTEA